MSDLNRAEILKQQFQLIKCIRVFFEHRGYLDVLTPPAVQHPGMETHLHPFRLWQEKSQTKTDLFLHTSPEFHMKELLSWGLKNIFTLSYCFRDEPASLTHRPQFIMLEWYHHKAKLMDLIEEVCELFHYCQKTITPLTPLSSRQIFTIEEIFQKITGVPILEMTDPVILQNFIRQNFNDIPLPSVQLEWDDLFFLIFLNKIEPWLETQDLVFLTHYPVQLAALSSVNPEDSRTCLRFEVYYRGMELGNCFQELRELQIHHDRLGSENNKKKEIYGYELPEPNVLLDAVERGIPQCTGIAMGVERLLSALTEIENPFYN